MVGREGTGIIKTISLMVACLHGSDAGQNVLKFQEYSIVASSCDWPA